MIPAPIHYAAYQSDDPTYRWYISRHYADDRETFTDHEGRQWTRRAVTIERYSVYTAAVAELRGTVPELEVR